MPADKDPLSAGKMLIYCKYPGHQLWVRRCLCDQRYPAGGRQQRSQQRREKTFMTEERKVSESLVETVHMVRPNHLNAAGRLFGGILMQWLDEVAGLVAKRHTRCNVITASVDNLRFIHGAYKGEMVVIIGKMTYVGNTSMEVRVDTYVENMEDGTRHPINRAYFTMVALDENDRPRRVPRLVLETETEKEEWKGAEKRREIRMRRKEEGF